MNIIEKILNFIYKDKFNNLEIIENPKSKIWDKIENRLMEKMLDDIYEPSPFGPILPAEIESDKRIFCAAIRYNKKIIFISKSHGECYAAAYFYRDKLREYSDPEEGFIDYRGNFITREKALKIAIKYHQVIKGKTDDDTRLFSEDLWSVRSLHFKRMEQENLNKN